MKIIAIANQKGGVGKTTTALNLAIISLYPSTIVPGLLRTLFLHRGQEGKWFAGAHLIFRFRVPPGGA